MGMAHGKKGVRESQVSVKINNTNLKRTMINPLTHSSMIISELACPVSGGQSLWRRHAGRFDLLNKE